MTISAPSRQIKRRHIIFFIWMISIQLIRLISRAIYPHKNTRQLAAVFFETYSKLWDFAEHSISHQGFNLPSALGGNPVNKVNRQLCQLYGMDYASLSFGGSSGALLTLLTAVLPKLQTVAGRDIILFDDICHQSAIGGLIFGRWKAVRLVRQRDAKYQTACPLTLETIQTAVELHGTDKIAAIILVLPSYDGFRSPSEDMKIYHYAKSRGISVVVDGAWDAMRFRQSDPNTPSLSSICDVWISSPHKRGLTPSSLGCILTNDRQVAQFWDEALDLGFRSSSVSFVEIMVAEQRLSEIISGDWDKAFTQAELAAGLLRRRITDVHPELYCIAPSDLAAQSGDPTHILISTNKIKNVDARDWAEILAAEFSLDVEKSTPTTLLLLCGSPSHLAQIELIIATLKNALNLTLEQTRSR